jgi:hypothetical protein
VSDDNPNQPSFDVTTSHGTAHVDADNAAEAALIGQGHIGGIVTKVEQTSGPTDETADAASTTSEPTPTETPAETPAAETGETGAP